MEIEYEGSSPDVIKIKRVLIIDIMMITMLVVSCYFFSSLFVSCFFCLDWHKNTLKIHICCDRYKFNGSIAFAFCLFLSISLQHSFGETLCISFLFCCFFYRFLFANNQLPHHEIVFELELVSFFMKI